MIRPVVAAHGSAGARRVAGAGRGFTVAPGDGESAPEPAGSVAGAAGVVMAGLLALQEWPAERSGDRAARRYGEALLGELAALQRALLKGEAPDLARLAALAGQMPSADDPALADAVAALALRARIELARREAGAERRGGGG